MLNILKYQVYIFSDTVPVTYIHSLFSCCVLCLFSETYFQLKYYYHEKKKTLVLRMHSEGTLQLYVLLFTEKVLYKKY